MEKVDASHKFPQADQAERAVLGCTSAPRADETCTDVNVVFAGCNRPGFPSFDLYEFTYESKPTPLTWELLTAETKTAGRPVLFGWCVEGRCGDTPRTSMGHWMVATDTFVCDVKDADDKIVSVRMVRAHNPAPCCFGQVLNMSYGVYANGGAGLKFWRNYYGVTPKGSVSVPIQTPEMAPAKEIFPPSKEADTEKNVAMNTARQCLFNEKNEWKAPDLLREAVAPPTEPAKVAAAAIDPIPRRYIPLSTLGALTTKEGQEALRQRLPPPLTVVALKNKDDDKVAYASVVLEARDKRFQVLAFEDYEAARRLILRAQEAKRYGEDPISQKYVEYVVLETGLHFILAADNDRKGGQDAIAILSEIDCRKRAKEGEEERVGRISLADLIERLTVSD